MKAKQYRVIIRNRKLFVYLYSYLFLCVKGDEDDGGVLLLSTSGGSSEKRRRRYTFRLFASHPLSILTSHVLLVCVCGVVVMRKLTTKGGMFDILRTDDWRAMNSLTILSCSSP